MQPFKLRISGMSCGHCVKAVTEALTESGATVSQVSVGSAAGEFDPSRTSVDKLIGAVSEAGYPAAVA